MDWVSVALRAKCRDKDIRGCETICTCNEPGYIVALWWYFREWDDKR